MDYDKTATAILEQVGGASNVGALTHCSTRLRFTLVDGDKGIHGMIPKSIFI